MFRSSRNSLIWPLLLGILGGIVAAVFVYYSFGLFYAPEITTLIRRETVSAEATLELKNIEQSLVYIYNTPAGLPPARAGGAPAGVNYLETAQAKYTAVALTSDGLIATGTAFKNASKVIAASYDRKTFALTVAESADEKVFVAEELGLTFYRAAPYGEINPPALKALTLAAFEEIKIGKRAVAVDENGAFTFHRVLSLPAQAAIYVSVNDELNLDSDNASVAFKLDGEVPPGAWIFFEDGKLAGIAKNDNKIIPAEFLNNIMRQYLKDGSFRPTTLGMRYFDLSLLIPLVPTLPKEGLWLKSQPRLPAQAGRPAIISGSPAAKAGLKEGDILVSFDGRRFDGTIPLPILLQRYRPGTEVEVVYLRDGKEERVKITLGGGD